VLLENENLRKLILMPQIDGGLERCLCHQMKANETFGFVDVRAPAWPGCKGRRRHVGGAKLQDHDSGNDEQTAAKRGKLTWKIHSGVPGSHQSKPCNSQDRARQNDGLRVR
jgi:hypothetical protein